MTSTYCPTQMAAKSHVIEYLNENVKELSDIREVYNNVKQTVHSLGQEVNTF